MLEEAVDPCLEGRLVGRFGLPGEPFLEAAVPAFDLALGAWVVGSAADVSDSVGDEELGEEAGFVALDLVVFGAVVGEDLERSPPHPDRLSDHLDGVALGWCVVGGAACDDES